jgi:hypothetical protein
MAIPRKYANVRTSPLVVEVTAGKQTIDIQLTD